MDATYRKLDDAAPFGGAPVTHIVFSSVAQRLDAGTYSTAIVRDLAKAPSAPMAASFAPLWTYAASALMGALIGLMLGGAL